MIVFSSGMNNNGCQNKHYPFEKTSSVVNQFLGIFSCSLVQRISKLVSQLMIRPHKLHKCLMKGFQGYRVKRHVWFSKFFKHDQPSIDHRSYTHNLSSCEIKPERKKGMGRTRANIFFGLSERPKYRHRTIFWSNFKIPRHYCSLFYLRTYFKEPDVYRNKLTQVAGYFAR